MDGKKTWHIEARIAPRADSDYRQYALRELKRRAGNELYPILEQMQNPAVVEINEEIIQAPDYGYSFPPYDQIRITISVTPVRYRDVEVVRSLPFDRQVYIDRPTFWRRVKYAITGR